MSQIPNDPELTGIASALGGLIPVPSGLDRDRLMFQAGALSRSRSRRDRWVWPSVAAGLALVVACESALLARRPAPGVVERIVVVREPAEASPAPAPAPAVASSREVESTPTATTSESLAFVAATPVSDSQRLQALVFRFGLDAFPEPVRGLAPADDPMETPESGSATAGALRRIELERLLKPGGHS